MAITQTLTGLTTVFTPPPSCSSSWTYEMEFYNSVVGGLLIQNALPVGLDTECFPPGFAYGGRVNDPIEVYSPGACPAGYATAAETFNGDTTLAVCCQSGFSYTSTFSQKDQFNSTTVLFAGCTSTYSLASGSTIVPARNDQDLDTTTVTGPIIMWAQPISVEFQQTDLTLFTTSTATSASTSTGTGTLIAQPSITASRPTPQPTISSMPTSSPNSGLSSGAKAGISVAAVVCALIIFGVIAFLFLRRRKAMKRHPISTEDDGDQWQRKELDGLPYRGELPASTYRGELYGSDIRLDRKSLPRKPSELVELE